ncbi:MAG: TolC family protein [bacterium]|nr:TolC family protein [bacterium]
MNLFFKTGCFLCGVLLLTPLSARGNPGPTSTEGTEVVVLNLEESIQWALEHNQELRAKDYDISIAQEKFNETKIIGYPVVEYEYNLAPVPKDLNNATDSFFSGDLTVFNKFKLGVGTPLTTFGKVQTGKSLAMEGVSAERFRKEQKKTEIIFKVKQLYNGVLLAYELDRILETTRKELDKEVQRREDSEDGGDPAELLKMKLLLFEVERRGGESKKKKKLAFGALQTLLGLAPQIRLELKDEKLRPVDYSLKDFKSYQNESRLHRPEEQLLNVGLQAKQKMLALEKRNMTPNLGVGAFFELGRAPNVAGVSATDDFNDPFNFTRAGVGLQLKGSFDFHKQFSKMKQAKGELQKMEIQRDLGRAGMDLELRQGYLEVEQLKEDVERSDEAGRLSRQLLFLTQSNFDLGLAEPKDLVDAFESLLMTRGKYFESVFNYNIAVAKLEQLLGEIPAVH